MPATCRFWQQGNCRFGDSCRFEHGPVSQANTNGNRFAPLQSQNNNPRNNSTNGFQEASSSQSTFALDKAAIQTDLSSERPQWILSAYGPGRQAPAQLFGGPLREQSFEEMRLLHYMGVASGNPQQAIQESERLVQAAEQQTQTVLRNIDGAIDYIVKAQNEHPNRIDIVRESVSGGIKTNPFTSSGSSSQNPNPFGTSAAQPQSSSNSFGASSQTQNPNPFGAPSQTTQNVNLFGASNAPSFGAPSQPGGFGQPSALGQKPNPFASTSNPSFGTPSQVGGGGAFGQPAALGQKPNPFGASSGNAVSNPSQAAPFSTAPAPAPANPFNQASPHPFGNPQLVDSWGTPSGQNPQANPFGTTSNVSLGAPSQAQSNPFSGSPQSVAVPNPFGGSAASSQATPFGTTPFNSTKLGVPSAQISATANPFGQPTTTAQNANANPFGVNGTSSSSAPTSGGQHGLESYSSKDMSGRLTMFKGKRVQYKDNEAGTMERDGTWRKIWFPDGPPRENKDTEAAESAYDEKTKDAYMYLQQHGSFEGGEMPMVPPKREWCSWDF